MRRLLQLTCLCLFISGAALAQNRYWVGTPANTDWHDASNWSLTSGGPGGASIPGELGVGATLTAIFDGGSSANAVVNTITSLASVQITSAYTGTITQSDILILSGGMTVAGGTFVGGSTLVITGAYSQTGGSVTLGDQANTISGNFNLTGTGTFTTGPGNLTLNGNVSIVNPTNFTAVTGTVIFDGNASSTLNVAGSTRAGIQFNNVTINKVNNTDDLLNNFSLPGADTLVVRGNLALSNGNLDNSNSVIRAEGNVTISQTFDGSTGGDLVFGGANNQTVVVNAPFGITLNSGFYFAKTAPEATVSFTTGLPSNTIAPFANPSAFFNVNSGTVNFPDNDQVDMNVINLTIGQNGTFISTGGTMNLVGNFLNNGGSNSFQHSNGTVASIGTGNRIFNVFGNGVNGSTTFYNLIINRTSAPGNLTINNGDTLVVANDLQLIDGTLAVASGATLGQGYLQLNGNLSTATAFSPLNNFVHVIFGGNGTQSIFMSPGTEGHINGPVTLNKSGGSVDLASDLIFDFGGQQVAFTSGVINSTATNLIQFGITAVAVIGNGYVDGPVQKTGIQPFNFPTGDGGFSAPIRATGNSGFNDVFSGSSKTFVAEYFHTNPHPTYDNTVIQNPIPNLMVSDAEYWRFAQVGTVPANERPYLWLSWENVRSGGLTDPSTVGIMAWLGSNQWARFGNNVEVNFGGFDFMRSGSRNTTTNEDDPVFTFGTIDSIANPLPVTWLSFTGRYYNMAVELNWSTSLEVNNAMYTVERSGDGDKYVAIGTLPGNGTTDLVSYYNFTDKEPLPGVNHYRIKQTDIDGKFSYSKEIKVTTAALSTNGLRLFPNPMTTNLPLTLENVNWRNKKVTVTIYNAAGGIVHQEQVVFGADSRSRLNISRLQKGSYFISTQFNDEKQTLSFVIQ